jgi:hypothetical protein
MANSTRRSIADNIVSTLAAISSGGGYNLTAGEVKRGFKHFNKVPENKLRSGYFAAYLAGVDEERTNAAQRTFSSIVKASLVCYVMISNSEDAEALEQAIDNVVEDVTKALMVDVTRGGHAVTTEIKEIDTDKGAFQPYASVELVVNCNYRAAVATP